MPIVQHDWYYECKVCGSLQNQKISEFMHKHAHGITAKLLQDCEIVRHRDGRTVTIKYPKDSNFFLKDTEQGNKRRRKIRIWIIGTDYGYSYPAAT